MYQIRRTTSASHYLIRTQSEKRGSVDRADQLPDCRLHGSCPETALWEIPPEQWAAALCRKKFQPGGFRRIRKLTHDPDLRHVSRCRFAASFPGSAQRKPCGHGGELFVLRPRRAKWAPQFGDAAHDLSRLESEGSPGAVQEFSFFDSEIAEAATGAGMEKSFAEEFAVRGVYQRMRGKNLVQCGKRSTRGKQQSASREFHSLFLRSRCKLPDGAVSQPPCLRPHPRDEFAAFTWRHLFCGVIGLAEFIRESFNEMNSLPREHRRYALINAHRDNRRPP